MKHNRNVILTGFTSFFTDVSSEMLYPLIQAFVSIVLAGQKTLVGPALGLIEGVAESTASLLKVFAGYYSDKIQVRKGTAIAGYGISALSKLLLFLASVGWYVVLASRFSAPVPNFCTGSRSFYFPRTQCHHCTRHRGVLSAMYQ